ncbi:MAG: heme ABC transporter ATP-binding protein [Desulfobulbaceae bacterium]|uniref:Heme ABC transporter ATP-binding protein n=1 Tax=Candidatus Desulfatifera sulfidica TaxID=2841691 RepID=A0A8J6T8N5_9BACT|nr:heme ABC transporter ATP-binding protein [Candidatus Desulfatifera sulfidica]
MSAVRIQGVGVKLGDTQVLRDLSLTVAQGEFFVVIGPNGSGKTTLLRLLASLLSAGSDGIEIFGRQLNDYSRRELARILALVPQQVHMDFPFSVRETVLMGRSPHLGLMSFERVADLALAAEAMEFTDVSHLADRRLDQLSGGERQRVIIARAICQQPRLILLDEPTAALDPAHQIKILDLLERLRQEQDVTVIMVSHDLNLAALYGDRLLLLCDGQLDHVGPPIEVLERTRLERVYGCTMSVEADPVNGFLRISPVPARYREQID